MSIRDLSYLFAFLNPTVYIFIGMGIGYMAALAVYEYCNHGRMNESDLLRWENEQLRGFIEQRRGIPAARQDGDDRSKADRRGQSK